MMPLVIIISILMVTTIAFDAMPKFNFRSGPENSRLFALVIIVVTVLALFPQTALFPIAILYIGYSVVRAFINHGKDEDEFEDESRFGIARKLKKVGSQR